MTLRNVVIFVLDLKCNIEKSNTYYWKPKEVSKQLNFFHFAGMLFIAAMFFGTKIFNLSFGSSLKCQKFNLKHL
jgi:hypothetical protein